MAVYLGRKIHILLLKDEKLRKEVALLREELRHGRRVITHRQAVHYFASRITPETVLEYIWWCGLPAKKRGRQWMIQLEDLFDWMLGKIGFESQKSTGIKKIMPPRYIRNVHARSGADNVRSARHAEKDSVPVKTREVDAHENRHL